MSHNVNVSFVKDVTESSMKPYDQRKVAERKLAAQAPQHLDSIASLLNNGDVPVRRLLIEILAHMTPSQRVYELLLHALFNDADVKVRRRAAAALGSTGDKTLQEHLVRAFEQEEHRFVQASIILALGALGFKWTPAWVERVGDRGPIAEAFRKASARSEAAAGGPQNTTGEYGVTRPAVAFMLECYPGVEKFVKTELDMRGMKGVCVPESGWLYINLTEATAGELNTLGELRTIISTYAIAAEKPVTDVSSLEDYLIDTCKEIRLKVNTKWNKLGFRLELPRMSSRAQYRKSVVSLARRITTETGLGNNPSNYSLDIRLARISDVLYVLWRDVRWHDPRRSEQRAVLPASIHPTVAAALCIAGKVDFRDVFCDPCCGAGTVIAERLGYGPAKKVFGFDISPEALSLSKQNLSRFGMSVTLRKADMRRLPLDDNSVDVVVANLPFGIRVGDRSQNRSLYKDFLNESQRVLSPKGRLVAYTHDASAFELACRESGWQDMKRLASVQAGGLTVMVYKGLRP